MKYNACVFLSEIAKGTSEVTQNAQFILGGLIEKRECMHSSCCPPPQTFWEQDFAYKITFFVYHWTLQTLPYTIAANNQKDNGDFIPLPSSLCNAGHDKLSG